MSTLHLTPAVTLLVLFAGVVHAAWNAIASRIEDRFLAFALIGLTETVVAAVALAVAGLPASSALGFAAGSAVIHVAYTYALLNSYRLGGFGRAYPLARGTAPLLVAVGAWFLADEHLGALQLAGICTIAAALLSLVFAGGRPGRGELPAIGAALLTGVTIAGYTVLDGLGVRHAGNPVGYVALLFVLQGPVVFTIAAVALRGRVRGFRGADIRSGVTAGVLSMLAYGIVVWAQTRGPLAVVSALRETSVISAALISALVFKEPYGRRRIGPAVAVVAGILLISA